MRRRRFLATVGAAVTSGVAGCVDLPGDGEPTTIEDGAPLRLERVRMRLDTPWGASFHPETGDLYVTELPGRIVRATGGDRGLVRRLNGTAAYGNGGLLGFAFDPDTPNDAYVFQTHDSANGLENRILRLDVGREFAVDGVVLDGIPANTVHNGGRLAFGPEGALWATTGDAGEPATAGSLDSLAGKVLRLTRSGEPWPGNPFGSRVYTYGHRNPQGISFVGGSVYTVDRGPGRADELNRLEAGGNYGWPTVAGPADEEPFVDPLVSWTPAIAPGGLAYYTGPIERWRDSFFVGALDGTHLRQVTLDADGSATQNELYRDLGRLRTTFTGPDDHLYFTTSNLGGPGEPDPTDDEIYRVRPP